MANEQDITRTLIEAVNVSRLAYVYRNQSGMVRVKRGWMHLAPKGSPDVVGFLLDGSGRFLGLEVKLPKEKPTDLQEEWRARILAAGGVAACVRSVAEAIDVVRLATKGALT